MKNGKEVANGIQKRTEKQKKTSNGEFGNNKGSERKGVKKNRRMGMKGQKKKKTRKRYRKREKVQGTGTGERE